MKTIQNSMEQVKQVVMVQLAMVKVQEKSEAMEGLVRRIVLVKPEVEVEAGVEAEAESLGASVFKICYHDHILN